MNDNKRSVYIVWALGEDNYGGTNWYPVVACCSEAEAIEYIAERENDYDSTLTYTSANIEAPQDEE